MTGRERVAILALAVGGFSIGSSEFVAVGLLPQIASAFWPSAVNAHAAAADAHAAQFVSFYAIGVVIGGPVLGAYSARKNPRPILLLLLAAMALSTAATALMPQFGLLLAFRLLAAIPHAAYFGVAAIEAAHLMGAGHGGRGVGVVLGGLALSNVIGVPVATWLGRATSWRVCYLIISLLFLTAFVGVFCTLPERRLGPRIPLLKSFGVLGAFRVHAVLLMGAVSAAGLFAIVAYSVPILVNYSGMRQNLVPWSLSVLGVGMTIGNILGGICADVRMRITMWMAFVSAGCGMVILLGSGETPLLAVGGLALLMFAMGAVSPFTQLSLMNAAGGNRTMGGALNSSCMNLGNAGGATLGGLVITSSLGYLGDVWVGLVVTGAAALLGLVVLRLGGAPVYDGQLQ